MIKEPADIFRIDYKKLETWKDGKLSVSNLKKSISKSKLIKLDKFIFSIGIRHIGQENAKILAAFFVKIDEFSQIFDKEKRDNLLQNLIELDGIGQTQIDAIENFFSNNLNKKLIKNLIKELEISNYSAINKSGKFSNKKLMFTGGFQKMSRSEAKSIAENNGGKVLGSMSNKLDILVVGDSKPTKKKVDQAKKLKIKIM